MSDLRILMIGATSAVAQGVAEKYAAHDAKIFCVARNETKMAQVADTLGDACAGFICADFNEAGFAERAIMQAIESLGQIDISLIAHGVLLDQVASEHDFEIARLTIETNLLTVVSFIIPLTEQLKKQGHGKIGVITSVAAERGRPRNFTYGAAKGAVNIYLQGLRSVLYGSGVEVYTFKMGPVDTPMTVDHPKNFSFATVDQISTQIVKAFQKKRYEVYLPPFWRLVMFFVRIMPEWFFQRLEFLSAR